MLKKRTLLSATYFKKNGRLMNDRTGTQQSKHSKMLIVDSGWWVFWVFTAKFFQRLCVFENILIKMEENEIRQTLMTVVSRWWNCLENFFFFLLICEHFYFAFCYHVLFYKFHFITIILVFKIVAYYHLLISFYHQIIKIQNFKPRTVLYIMSPVTSPVLAS